MLSAVDLKALRRVAEVAEGAAISLTRADLLIVVEKRSGGRAGNSGDEGESTTRLVDEIGGNCSGDRRRGCARM